MIVLAKYVLHPGPVRSRSDGQIHHITARQLADLYGVSWAEVMIDKGQGWERGLTQEKIDSMIHLYPRQDGKYEKVAR